MIRYKIIRFIDNIVIRMGTDATLGFIISDHKVLLIMKKRGFGMGKINGPGGKIRLNETPVDCVVREVEEEIGLQMIEPKEKGLLIFYFGETEEPDWKVHVFLTDKFSGELKESEEAVGNWYTFEEIPFEMMWEDDKYWLPQILDGKHVEGEFWFTKDMKKLLRYKVDIN